MELPNKFVIDHEQIMENMTFGESILIEEKTGISLGQIYTSKGFAALAWFELQKDRPGLAFTDIFDIKISAINVADPADVVETEEEIVPEDLPPAQTGELLSEH